MEPNQVAFVDAFESELRAAVDDLGGSVRFSTVFIGGGTPSVLRRDLLDRLFDAIAPFCDRRVTKEFTVELNPEDVTDELVRFLVGCGVDRISVGVQSMNEGAQVKLGRCTPARNRGAIARVMHWFDNVSFDVLLGVPGRTMEELAQTVDELVGFHPPHFSVYCLEPGGDMERAVKRFFEKVDAGQSADEYRYVCARLGGLRYRHYEVSNFALPGRESLHNRAYWTGRDYLGIGPGAHSFVDGRRFHNAPSLRDYFGAQGRARIAARRYDQIDEERAATERMMLALRTDDGMPLVWCACGVDTIESLRRDGLAEVGGGRIRLTDRGFLLADEILLRLSAT